MARNDTDRFRKEMERWAREDNRRADRIKKNSKTYGEGVTHDPILDDEKSGMDSVIMDKIAELEAQKDYGRGVYTLPENIVKDKEKKDDWPPFTLPPREGQESLGEIESLEPLIRHNVAGQMGGGDDVMEKVQALLAEEEARKMATSSL